MKHVLSKMFIIVTGAFPKMAFSGNSVPNESLEIVVLCISPLVYIIDVISPRYYSFSPYLLNMNINIFEIDYELI
jgi:hypothetical protein